MKKNNKMADEATHQPNALPRPDKDLLKFSLAISGIGTWQLDPRSQTVTWDARCKELYGFAPDDEVPYEQVLRYMHPDDRGAVDNAVMAAVGGANGGRYEIQFRTVGATDGKTRWLLCKGQAFFGEDGRPVLFAGIVEDITERKLGRLALEKSEQFARNVVQDSPVAKFITVGDDLVIEMVNKEMQALLDRDRDLIGRPLLDVIPAFTRTSLPKLLRRVRQTGERIEVSEESFTGLNLSQPGLRHYYHTHSPLRDEHGEIYGVISSWIDITVEVELRNKVASTLALLDAAIESASLGTFEISPALGVMEVSRRVREWMGFDPDEPFTQAEALATLTDDAPLRKAIREALNDDGNTTIDVEYQIVNRKTGALRYVRSRGQVFIDETRGKILVGTTQDISAQRNQSLALEQEVHLRTVELAAAVEELQATNEELAESNEQLTHSNEELAQYAYVASHDLQEPLRKIQVFSGMLERKPALDDGSRELVGKIGHSASRMGLLIRDLLAFSRLLKSDTLYRPTDLNEIVAAVLNDFELIEKEKDAVFVLEKLPVVQGIGLQMNQLFYNLISNALKFTRPGVAPEVRISAEEISGIGVTRYIQGPLPFARYYRICVRDNGIGFDAQYAEQIFQVFKRLHGRETYPGSGIGLALCRRIAANHNGALYTESTPGEGSTFCLILPDRQDDSPSSLPDGLKW